jgi:FkbM family methyltransferase
MMNTFRSLNFIARHPLNRDEPLRAMGRVLAWQLAMRLRPHAVAVPFVGQTRLLVARGMTGATGNVYCGLHEFEDMAFVMHALRTHDLFVDVGANVGAYTVLAAGAVGARCIAFEPVASTFSALMDNLRLNALLPLVDARNEGIAATSGELLFSTAFDTVNHVLSAAEVINGAARVPVTTLDQVLRGAIPTVIKVDVEGYETQVIGGADATLRTPGLLALLIELNGSGCRYGFNEKELHQRILGYGFSAARYDPLTRRLEAAGSPGAARRNDNTLYVRNMEALQERLLAAPRYFVRGVSL